MTRRPIVFSLLALLIFPLVCNGQTINFTSNSSWLVKDSMNNSLGGAQAVCLNDSSPSPCPISAIKYGFSASGWEADLTPIADAQWIWAPGVTGSSTPAELAEYRFSKSFLLDALPTEAILFIAADDFASIYVNGSLVGTVGSTADILLATYAANNLAQFDISPFLAVGDNLVEIVGQNGIGLFAQCSNCTYSQHPAGVVFGGTITTVPIPAAIWLFGSALAGFGFLGRKHMR